MDIFATILAEVLGPIGAAVKKDPQDLIGYSALLILFRDRLPFWRGGGVSLHTVNERLARIEGMLMPTKRS